MSEVNNDGWKLRQKELPDEVPEIETTKVEIVGVRIPFIEMTVLVFKGFFAFMLALLLLFFVGLLWTVLLGGSMAAIF